VIRELGALATRLSQVQQLNVSDLIAGKQDLPSDFATGGTYLLVASADMPSGIAVETLRRAARETTPRLLIHAGVHEGTDVAVICSDQHTSSEALSARLSTAAVRHGIRCVLTDVTTTGLPGSFQQARSVLRAAPVGCQAPAQLRSRLFVRLITEALHDLDQVGADPVAGLVVSHPDFARALLAWLDTHGDVAAAAATVACHGNTLRYRIRRAGELLGGDLHDPAFRLEVHLRLLAALHQDRTP
jgi:sugar diacid utilization regulator